MLDLHPFIIFSRSKIILPPEIIKDFTTLNTSGPIFKTVLPKMLEGLIKGPMFMLGTDSFKSYELYVKTCPNSIILLRWLINGKSYIVTSFDFERVLKTEILNSNVQDISYYYN